MKFENRYSWSDRLVHRIAFSTGSLQIALADIEELLFKPQLTDLQMGPPVFVTALPRAGTTILLNLLVKSGLFASHTYRDMPFVLCPMIWQRLVNPFQAKAEVQERAHGDGLTVSADSSEAFEEVIWRQFWPTHYNKDRIEPWQNCDDPEFLSFFNSHIRKIISLRYISGRSATRYVSKNNLNIARLSCLPQVFPNAKLVVLFREPIQHAASLLKQHEQFLDLHRRDSFAKKYMEGIGHFDFGENLRPVNFNNWMQRSSYADPTTLNFWLQYWIETYQNVISQRHDTLHLLSYRALTLQPEAALHRLAAELEIDPIARLTDQSSDLRPPREHKIDTSQLDPETVDAATALYDRLETCYAL